MNRDRLYGLLLLVSLAAAMWIVASWYNVYMPVGCPFKYVTGLPCPSCGTTRSVIHVIQGNYTEAVATNPLGIPVLLLLLVIPSWIGYDWVSGRGTAVIWYQKVERWLRRRWIAIPLLLLLAANWIWNIYKGL